MLPTSTVQRAKESLGRAGAKIVAASCTGWPACENSTPGGGRIHHAAISPGELRH